MLHRILKWLLAFPIAAVFLTQGIVCRAADGLSLSDQEKAYLENSGTLRVGYVQDRIPVSFRGDNGELSGVSRYLFDRIAEISGLSFEYVPLPGGAVTYDYLMDGEFDLVTSVEYNRENQGARGILISNPYFSSRKVVVARKDFVFSYDAPLSVALCSGSQTIKTVLHNTYPNYSILDYDSIEACFSAVKAGEADMMILNQYVVEYWLSKPAYENLKVIPILGLDDELCFSAVVPYDENGNPVGEEGAVLISILNKAIDQLQDEEVDSYTIQACMENRYTLTLSDFLYRYKYSVSILAVSLLLIAVLVFLLFRQRIQSLAAKADAKARSQFLSTMSHEIRTPLNGLIGLNYLMARHSNDPEQLSRYLEQSTATARYLLSLVSDILDMSLLHNQDMKIEKKPVDLETLFSTAEAIVQNDMAQKKIDFQMKVQLCCPYIIGDGVRIQQILQNFLDNARKFTPEGGRVTVTVQQSLQEDGQVLTRMDVADTGKGMSEAFRKNIFDAFAQEQNTVSKGNQGVGLGLAICHKLAVLMDGTLDFTSEPEKGSVFTFSFPAMPAPDPKETQDLQGVSVAEKAAKPRILIVEDNELNGEIMLELLSENGFSADLAADGKLALKRFQASAPGEYGVILMDLLMPEMDGFEAAAAIRALARDDAKSVRIFACSANCTEKDRERALASGMDEFLDKPIDVDLLLQKICG